MPASTRVDKLIIAEALRATEAGAIAASRLMGRGDREGADAAAVKAMREAMDDAELSGTIVIGEGERDEAPMLYIGEQVGNPDTAISVDIAVDPLEGTNLVATGSANATAVLAAAEPGGLMHAPDTYLEKLIVGPFVAGSVSITDPRRDDAEDDRRSPRAEGLGHHRRHPRPAAPRAADRRGPRGRCPDQAHRRRRPDGRHQRRGLRYRRARGDGHRRRAGGRPLSGRAEVPGR